MNKSLKSLFESDVLTEETKQVLNEAWDTAIASKEAELEVTYSEKLNEAKTELTSSIGEMIEEAVSDELAAIGDELTEARTLEIRYAKQLNEFKEQYDVKQQEQLKEMVDEVVSAEMNELKEDIEQTKKLQFAMTMFESFQEVFRESFGGEDMGAKAKLEEATKELDKLRREKILDSMVESLTDDAKAVALTILEGVATENLEKRFESIRPILLAESETPEGEKPLEENDKETKGKVVLESEESAPEEEPVNESVLDPRVASMLQRSLKYARNGK